MPDNKLAKVEKAARASGRKFGLTSVTVTPASSGVSKYVVCFQQEGVKHRVSFGHRDYEDYHDHQDRQRRESYIARASKIRAGGKLTVDDPTRRNFWAMRCLWAW